jgi:hypothetical protein
VGARSLEAVDAATLAHSLRRGDLPILSAPLERQGDDKLGAIPPEAIANAVAGEADASICAIAAIEEPGIERVVDVAEDDRKGVASHGRLARPIIGRARMEKRGEQEKEWE